MDIASARGAESAQAKLVFADNLYAYGPQTEPLVETMPPTTQGKRPALRASMTRALLEAHERGRVRVTIGRASDFDGPRARNAVLRDVVVVARIARVGRIGCDDGC